MLLIMPYLLVLCTLDGCLLTLLMSLKLIRRRMLPPTLLSGLLFPSPPELPSPSSIRILSGLWFVIGGGFCTGAPALKLKSSKKFSRSLANFTRASSKLKSPNVPPPPFVVGPLIVTLLLLLRVSSRSSRPWIEVLVSFGVLLNLFQELLRE